MKILMVNSVSGTGSTGRICTDMCDVLEKEGHECIIAYGRGSSPSKYNSYRIGNKLDNYLHVFNTRIFDNHGFSSKNTTKKFIEYIDNLKPDIIHIHNIHGYYLNIEIFFNYLKKSFKGKVLWTLHDCWPFSPHSAFIDYSEEGKLPETEKNIKNYPKSLFFNNSKINYIKKKEIFSNVPNLKIITPSVWLKNMVNDSFLSNYSCEVINNGIDIDIFNYNDANIETNQHKKIILGVANIWEPRKGLNIFNELSEIISDEFQITLVGKYQTKERNKKIIYKEHISSTQEMAKLYRKSYVFVNPTFEDNYPTTNLEAIACGIPIILFDTGGNSEMIFDQKGVLTKNKDALSIKNELNDIYSNFKKVDEEFLFKISKKEMFDKYMKVYEEG